MKKIVIVLGIILALSFVNAFNFGISPGKIQINGGVGDFLCQNISLITSDKNVLVKGEDKWISEENDVKKITDYLDNASDYGLEVIYPKNVQINNEYNINFCVKGSKTGEFNGVIIYRTTGGIGGASWIKVKLTDEVSAPITGAIVGDNSKKMVLLAMVLSTVILVVVLFVLMSLRKDQRKEGGGENKVNENEVKEEIDEEDIEEVEKVKKKKKSKAI